MLEMFVLVAEHDGPRRDHLGVEQRSSGDLPQKIARMSVGVRHHWRDT